MGRWAGGRGQAFGRAATASARPTDFATRRGGLRRSATVLTPTALRLSNMPKHLMLVLAAATACGPVQLDTEPLNDDVVDAVQQAVSFEPISFLENFDPDWETTQTAWRRATWSQNGTEMHPSRAFTSDEGHLVQVVLPGSPYRGGSIETNGEFGYGRWQARLRPSSVPGVLNSMFIKDWDDRQTPADGNDGLKAEVDIEFLSYTFSGDTGKVWLAVHFDGQQQYGTMVDLDFNPSKAFRIWGFDVLPNQVRWHVNGKFIHTYKFPAEKIAPRYEMFFNSWTRPDWINGPPAAEARYLVDWVRFSKVVNDPTCATGVPHPQRTVCCAASCGTCGGPGCGQRPGGTSNCCGGAILAADRWCSGSTPPCVLSP
ncbi:MAG: glycoside hydrolase family 16 protein [Myxococcaceae bacterium]|nr:glycoside hydrolase family 16 protein [Myxococcaceae bacterium]